VTGFAIGVCAAYNPRMPRKPIELPSAVALAFVEDMRAFFAEADAIKRGGWCFPSYGHRCVRWCDDRDRGFGPDFFILFFDKR
jgi:hypothetical protein